MDSNKLGFTFYTNDWITSEAFEELTPTQRYYYLEVLFWTYSNNLIINLTKTKLEFRLHAKIEQKDFDCVLNRFNKTENEMKRLFNEWEDVNV